MGHWTRLLMVAIIALATICSGLGSRSVEASAAPAETALACQAFPETGIQVCDPFLAYWRANGGLAQQGYPISAEFDEVNPTDGKTYRTQYFERARFEYHPENPDPRYQVLLGLLGREQYQAKYPGGRPPTNLEGRPDYCFVETQRCVAEPFLSYWREHGGLAQQGLPLSDQFIEISAIDGKLYQVQYFERARFESHPEQRDPQYRVLLGLLGVEQLRAKYPYGAPNGPVISPPVASSSPTVLTFGDRPVGTTSATQRATLTSQRGTLIIAGMTIAGPNPGDFKAVATTCAGRVPAGTSCWVEIRFAPTAVGAREATLRIASDAADSPHTFGLRGSGTPASGASPAPSPASGLTITATPPSGPVGTIFDVAASGFTPGARVVISMTDSTGRPYFSQPKQLDPGQTNTNVRVSSDGFRPETYTVTFRDPAGPTGSGSFTITPASATSPAPVAPGAVGAPERGLQIIKTAE